MNTKIILTGATGMVGEGVLLECLKHPDLAEVLTGYPKQILEVADIKALANQ